FLRAELDHMLPVHHRVPGPRRKKAPAQRGRVGRAVAQPDVKFAGTRLGVRGMDLSRGQRGCSLEVAGRTAMATASWYAWAMPVQWTISHSKRLVLAVARSPAGASDIESYLHSVALAGGMPYAKIFCIADVDSVLSPENIAALGDIVRHYALYGR